MESGWNVWVWLVGEVSRGREWVESMGVATGCGCKEVYRSPHTTHPYYSCVCSFSVMFFYKLYNHSAIYTEIY